jgi:hypothetical protein
LGQIDAGPELRAIVPASICPKACAHTLTLTVDGVLFAAQDAPSVAIGGKSYVAFNPSGCTALPPPADPTWQLCTSLEITIPQNDLDKGNYDVVVTNPAELPCASTPSAIQLVALPGNGAACRAACTGS